MKTRCLIVDDEPLAIKVIQSHLEKLPDMEVVASCINALEAFQIVHEQPVDLIILDIHMPRLTGLEFIKSLEFPPRIIVTTAYREYALEGFELDVVDYLLKPVSFPRFLRAIDKFRRLHKPGSEPIEASPTPSPTRFIHVKADRKVLKIDLEDIVFIESLNDYVKIHTSGKPIVTKQRISELADRLGAHEFLRIHRSFLVSARKISAYSTDEVQVGAVTLPISRSYRKTVQDYLDESDRLL